MTRKKFIKLLMGYQGYDRNRANRMADSIVSIADINVNIDCSYKEAYEIICNQNIIGY